MDSYSNSKYATSVARHLTQLKLISRLLSHELHSQANSKTITLSREEVDEIQTGLDLFIEELGRRQGPAPNIARADTQHLSDIRN